MSIFEDKAEQIHNEVTGGTVAFDPATVQLIAQLLIEVIQLYQDCRKPQEKVLTSMQSPNFFDRWRFRRLARKRLGNNANDIVEKSYVVGKTLTIEDVNEMYAAVPAIFIK
jgi:hypothetical protein